MLVGRVNGRSGTYQRCPLVINDIAVHPIIKAFCFKISSAEMTPTGYMYHQTGQLPGFVQIQYNICGKLEDYSGLNEYIVYSYVAETSLISYTDAQWNCVCSI